MLSTSAPDSVIRLVERQIGATDEQLDALVHGPYVPVTMEMRTVEGGRR